MKIHFHWIWAAINLINDNTYFLIEDWEDKIQVDCSWWLWLTRKIKFDNYNFTNLFISHKHTDHILWFFHLARIKDLKLNIFCSKDVEKTIKEISILLWWKKKTLIDSWNLFFNNIDNLENKTIWNFELKPINLNSKKIEQFWFLLINKWIKILFFWDEAVWVLNRNDLKQFEDIDYLIIEALVPKNMSKKAWWNVDTEKIHHITSKEAWIIATKLNAKNLILIHTMDICKKDRQEILTKDAETTFSWKIIVPNSWDIIEVI